MRHTFFGCVQGDVVTLLRQLDQHWFEGQLQGRKGIFPANYVEVC